MRCGFEGVLFEMIGTHFHCDAPPGKPADAGALSDVATRFLKRLANVFALDLSDGVAQVFRKGPLQIDGERRVRFRGPKQIAGRLSI